MRLQTTACLSRNQQQLLSHLACDPSIWFIYYISITHRNRGLPPFICTAAAVGAAASDNNILRKHEGLIRLGVADSSNNWCKRIPIAK